MLDLFHHPEKSNSLVAKFFLFWSLDIEYCNLPALPG